MPSSPAEPQASAAGSTVLLAAALSLIGAVGLFSLMSALVKLMGERYPVGQIVFCRGLFATFILLALAPAQGGWQVFRTARPLGHLLRSVTGLGAMAFSFAAVTMLPLAEAAALGFAAPLLIALLAALILGERVTRTRWLALLIGFAGIVAVTQPGTAAFSWGAPLALAAAVCVALAMISIRSLGRSERGLTIALYYQLLCTVAGGLSMLVAARLPTAVDMAALVAIGVLGGLAQLLMTRAYMAAPASWIAPFEYTAILWSILLGLLIWGEVPDAFVLGGAVLVILGGILVAREAGGRGAGR